MRNEFTAIIERDGEWYIAYCPEIPGANGQGTSIEECRASLADFGRPVLPKEGSLAEIDSRTLHASLRWLQGHGGFIAFVPIPKVCSRL